MPVPETSRQYLPDLEARWKLSRRKILELARDGKLALWITLLDGMYFSCRANDGHRNVETSNHLELRISTESLERLCEHAELENYSHVWRAVGRFNSSIKGFLRDGREVEAWRVKPPHLPRGYCGPSVWIQIHFSKVFADLDDVKRLDREFHGDGNGTISSAQEPRSVTDHQVTVPQTAKQGGRPKTQLRQGVEALYREKLAAGQTDILLPGNVEMFMLELRRIVNDNANDELSDKIKEHIRKVSKPSGEWVVHVQDPPDTGGKVLRKNEKPGGYGKKAVSSNLSDLRKEYPVE